MSKRRKDYSFLNRQNCLIVPVQEQLVIHVKYGGLGDHLFYSHLPRIAKETGAYDRVLISNYSEYRHTEYKELIWDLNPFVDGFADESGLIEPFGEVEPGLNLLDKIMLRSGLDDGKRFHEPEVYFKPVESVQLVGKSLFDPNFVSFVGEIQPGQIEGHFGRERPDLQMSPRDRSHSIAGVPLLTSSSLKEFCGIICSCKKLICLASGTATLAAALGKPATVLYGTGQNRMFHHSRLHTYVELNGA